MRGTAAEFRNAVANEKEGKKNEKGRKISSHEGDVIDRFSKPKAMNEKQTPQPEAEQLLKLLDMQLTAARERRLARESSRSKTGVIGLVAIVVGAVIALGMLLMMLEQMRAERPAHADAAG